MNPYSKNGIILSVHPVWLGKMAEGKKTLEIRKKLPRLQTPFKVYLYCTKLSENQIYRSPEGVYLGYSRKRPKDICCAGRVVGEFTCTNLYNYSTRQGTPDTISTEEIVRRSCLSFMELYQYECINGKQCGPDERSGIVAMEISDITFYDRPKLLLDYGLTASPMSWSYARKVPE